MALRDALQDDLKAALLGGNRFEADTLRGLKAALLNEEVAQNKRDEGLADDEAEKIVAREVKKRRESIALYEQNDRADLADAEKAELDILEKYLPKQLTEAEIQTEVDAVIAGMGDVTMQQMGQVIGAVKTKLGTSADGAIVAKIVKNTLTQ